MNKKDNKSNSKKKVKLGPGVSKAAHADATQSKLSLKFMKGKDKKFGKEGEENKSTNDFSGMKTAELGKNKKVSYWLHYIS